jgi:hypothetical protein
MLNEDETKAKKKIAIAYARQSISLNNGTFI